MYERRIAGLCLDATSGLLEFSDHYYQRLFSRPTPSRGQIRFLLCEDDAQVIEDYTEDNRGPCCLIRGTTDFDGRIGHVVCANLSKSKVITAYFPAETEPDKWEDDYRRRVGGGLV